MWVITEHWAEFPALYCGSLLVVCFKHSRVHMSIPTSQLIHPHHISPLVTISLFSKSVSLFLFCKYVQLYLFFFLDFACKDIINHFSLVLGWLPSRDPHSFIQQLFNGVVSTENILEPLTFPFQKIRKKILGRPQNYPLPCVLT